MSKFDLTGKCAFCGNSSHDFPDDAWHEKKHQAGWHGCEVYGGFHFCKPGCDAFKIADGVKVVNG